jgi:hypothetical protein
MEMTVDEVLEHFGVPGMRWGVRKAEPTVSRPMAIHVEPGIDKNTKAAAIEVATLMHARYGQNISRVKVLDPNDPEHEGELAYAEKGTKAGEETLYIQKKNLVPKMEQLKKTGWMAPEASNVRGLLTHESAHALLHVNQELSDGPYGPRVSGGPNFKAREKALDAAFKTARKDRQNVLDVSGYARHAQSREELEAEMLSQYHWVSNPPRYVTVWGQTLHKEMGIDPTPFREVKRNG